MGSAWSTGPVSQLVHLHGAGFDVVVDGTGDLEGITGTGQVAADGSFTYTLTAPLNQ